MIERNYTWNWGLGKAFLLKVVYYSCGITGPVTAVALVELVMIKLGMRSTRSFRLRE